MWRHIFRSRTYVISIFKPIVVERFLHIKHHTQGGKQKKKLHDAARIYFAILHKVLNGQNGARLEASRFLFDRE
ncbi:MAG TPA: hypothetical protein VF600_17795 [Abditibacteriaceae bacterium]|jgi:hypothetical protein